MGVIMKNKVNYTGGGGSGGASALADLEDVELTTPTDGQALVYDAENDLWINGNVSGGGNTLVIQDASIYSTDEQQIGVWIDGKPLYQKTFIFSNISTLTGNQSYQTDLSNVSEAFLEGEIIEGANRYAIPWAGNSGYALGFFFSTSTNYIWTKGTDTFSNATLKITVKYTKTTDAAGSGGYKAYGLSPIIYSEEEREVGVWTDGKPLYQKTVHFLNVSASGSVSFNVANVETVFLADAGTLYGSATLPYVHGAVPSVSVGGFFGISANDLTWEFRSGSNATTPLYGFITARYTKTTDQAGSGIWTTTGEYAHHYSTTEHVIGTWIDGKPLYEKVIIDSRSGGFSTGEYEIYSDASTYHLIPNGLQGMFYNSAGSHYPVPWIGNNNSTSLHKNASGKIVLTVRNDTYNNYILEVIIRYTKTTD